MERRAVRQPRLRLVDLGRLALEVIEHIHVQLQILVDLVPILHDLIIVRAQPHDDPGRQVPQWS